MSLRKINALINAGDLLLHKTNISGELPGFVYASTHGKIHVFVDSSLSLEAERETLFHECGHALLHLSEGSHLVGLDDREHEREKEANEFSKKCCYKR